MGRTEQSYAKIYERDKATNSFIISVATQKYADIFNELDPAPLIQNLNEKGDRMQRDERETYGREWMVHFQKRLVEVVLDLFKKRRHDCGYAQNEETVKCKQAHRQLKGMRVSDWIWKDGHSDRKENNAYEENVTFSAQWHELYFLPLP